MANFGLIGWVYTVHALFFGIGMFCCPSWFLQMTNSVLTAVKLTPVSTVINEHTYLASILCIAIGLLYLQATLFRHSQVLENASRAKIVVFLLSCYVFFVTKVISSGLFAIMSTDLLLGLWMILSVSSAKAKDT